ncbi:hypothetical protein OGAPHI_005297 [Ogataea philodendri]|uniref:Rho-GAP domain-containing protein n=1 Tax=Ogataea philodendri TaxID=1378263 RepID=A0A9P8P186_9ASCO|nr:uncharacterized protein OGAPHI_005297 [Ogataea philodendri]KAH3663307.1 hypothetical protein OGAPHI_005297 [Ogataea philodendri]
MAGDLASLVSSKSRSFVMDSYERIDSGTAKLESQESLDTSSREDGLYKAMEVETGQLRGRVSQLEKENQEMANELIKLRQTVASQKARILELEAGQSITRSRASSSVSPNKLVPPEPPVFASVPDLQPDEKEVIENPVKNDPIEEFTIPPPEIKAPEPPIEVASPPTRELHVPEQKKPVDTTEPANPFRSPEPTINPWDSPQKQQRTLDQLVKPVSDMDIDVPERSERRVLLRDSPARSPEVSELVKDATFGSSPRKGSPRSPRQRQSLPKELKTPKDDEFIFSNSGSSNGSFKRPAYEVLGTPKREEKDEPKAALPSENPSHLTLEHTSRTNLDKESSSVASSPEKEESSIVLSPARNQFSPIKDFSPLKDFASLSTVSPLRSLNFSPDRRSFLQTPSPKKPLLKSASHQQQPSDSSQFDYISSSFDSTVITVDTCVDPSAVNDKKEDFSISFMVNSNERSGELVPLYMVRQTYTKFITLDQDLRRLGLRHLPMLPDRAAFLKIDPLVWDTQKSIVRMYVSELCRVMRGQRGSEVWKLFKGFFTPYDAHDMSKREATVVEVGSKNLKKVFRLTNLSLDSIEHYLTITECATKTKDVLHVNDVNLSRDNQILTISRKKRKSLRSVKHHVLYCESVMDAEDWFRLIMDYQSNETDQASLSSSPSNLTAVDYAPSVASTPTQTETVLPSPAMSESNSKWFSLKRGNRDSVMPASQPPADLLEFKAMPYSGTMVSMGSVPTPSLQPNDMSFQQLEATPKYFGSTLQESFERCPDFKIYDRPVPSVVYRCLSYLGEKKAVYSEGIFRLNGMMAEVNKIQEIFNEKSDCDLAALESPPDVHSIATLFKRYLRTLRVTVIPEEEAKELMTLTLSSDHASSVPKVKQTLSQLPKLNFDVLYALFKYFQEVLKFKDLNKMSVGALSVLMAPNLTPFDGAKEICSELLTNYHYYFEDGEIVAR